VKFTQKSRIVLLPNRNNELKGPWRKCFYQ
jgi:hypothetical protein